MTNDARAFTCGCAGLTLTGDERDFMRRMKPWGLILFARNIKDRSQVSALTREFREVVGREDAPVLIDQEGGRVQRMRPPEWLKYPPAAAFARVTPDLAAAADLARLGARLMAHDLAEVGITVDCAPVLDVPAPGAHDIVGDRAYADSPDAVARLGRAVCEGLLAGGVLPVVKHIPGHGRGGADSHLELPVVDATRAELEAADFAPFRALADMPMAMTAHIVFSALDAARPATLSPIVVREIIRGAIGFDGLLMSDDLSMKALAGSFAEKTEALFSAGLDMALYCFADLADAAQVAEAAPMLDGRRGERAAQALARLRRPEVFDPVDAAARLHSALAMQV